MGVGRENKVIVTLSLWCEPITIGLNSLKHLETI